MAVTDLKKSVITSSLDKAQLVTFFSDLFANTQINPDSVAEFIISQKNASSTKKMTSLDFVNLLHFNITDTLKRSLTDKWMVGIYSKDSQNLPFVLLTTDFFQNAFAGMLKWETSMPEEFADIFNYRNKTNTGSTASSTSLYSLYDVRGSFRDKIVMNRDVREFVSDQGEVLILYTFIDKNTLLITTSEAVISTIIERIEKQTYIR